MPASPQCSGFYRLVGLRLYKRPQTARLRGQSMSMASRETPADPRRPVPRLYLVTPQDRAGLADRFAQALDAADVAAVLLRLPQADERTQVNHAKALAPTVQGKGAALLLDGHPDLAARAGADGAHLSGIEAFMTALATLKPARIAGCGRLATRHDAMVVAEAGKAGCKAGPQSGSAQARCDSGRSPRTAAGRAPGRGRPCIRRLPARLLHHRLCGRDPSSGRAERHQGDDAARRALCQRLGRSAR